MLSFTRPNLSTLIQQAQADFQAQLPGADTTLRRSNITVTAKVLAGLVNGLYGYIDWIWQQIFSYAPLWAFVFNIPQKQPTAASGNGVFTGTNGTDIPTGTLWQDSLNNQYATTADGTIVGGTATIPILAKFKGSAGNLAPNAPLTIINSLANINPNGAVDGSGLTGGTDLETVPAWCARVQATLQDPPQGGTANDYETWVLDNPGYPGATRCWCIPLAGGAGTVSVYFMMDGTRVNGLPNGGDIAAVTALLDGVAPGTDQITVDAPPLSPVAFTITGVPAAQQPAVAAALAAFFLTIPSCGGALDLQSQIIPVIQGAALSTGVNVTVPAADLPPVAGTLYTLGAITW